MPRGAVTVGHVCGETIAPVTAAHMVAVVERHVQGSVVGEIVLELSERTHSDLQTLHIVVVPVKSIIVSSWIDTHTHT